MSIRRRVVVATHLVIVKRKQSAIASSAKTKKRFYKHVGISKIETPWLKDLDNRNTVSSPISAGVDDTQSCSGMNNKPPTKIEMKNNLFNEKKEWFGVTLDGRIVKTPLGMILCVPSAELAAVIASEWDAQTSTLQPTQMPCTTLSCTTIDQTWCTQQEIIDQCIAYLKHDTSCFHADPLEDHVLYKRQCEAWDGLYEFIQSKYGSYPFIATGAQDGILLSRGKGLPHPPDLIVNVQNYLEKLNPWQLTPLKAVVTESKSCLVGLAFLEKKWDASKVINACRVEEEFNIENWGCVEGGHDYDRLNCRIQILAASLFLS